MQRTGRSQAGFEGEPHGHVGPYPRTFNGGNVVNAHRHPIRDHKVVQLRRCAGVAVSSLYVPSRDYRHASLPREAGGGQLLWCHLPIAPRQARDIVTLRLDEDANVLKVPQVRR